MVRAEALIQTALLGEAVDAGPALVFVADDEMKYIAVNRRACEVLGYTRDELLRLRVNDVAKTQDAPQEYDEMLARGFRHGTTFLTCKSGETVEFAYQARKTTVAGLLLYISIGFTES